MGSLHDGSFEEFTDLCRRLQRTKTRVVVLTELMHKKSLSIRISLGTVTGVYPHADENVVVIAVTGRTWLNGQYIESMSGAPYTAFAGVATEERRIQTTVYEDTTEMREFLVGKDIYVGDVELGL